LAGLRDRTKPYISAYLGSGRLDDGTLPNHSHSFLKRFLRLSGATVQVLRASPRDFPLQIQNHRRGTPVTRLQLTPGCAARGFARDGKRPQPVRSLLESSLRHGLSLLVH
jgi:hypothetical protein